MTVLSEKARRFLRSVYNFEWDNEQNKLFKTLSQQEQAIISNALLNEEKRLLCQFCEESIKLHGHVCDNHYHDYMDCGRDDCRICLIYRGEEEE